DDLGEIFGRDLEELDVETVGGLLAQQLGRVPLPGAEAEVAGLRLRAEGGKDRRGRMKITTVVVRPVAIQEDQPPDEGGQSTGGGQSAQQQDRSVEHA